MNFCPKCQFMLFTKIDSESKQISNYCKNCRWSGEYIRDDNEEKISIYKKNYNSDYISNSINSNPHIVHDNTLPRINNIKCINDNCVSNISPSHAIKIIITYNNDIEADIIEHRSKQNIKLLCSNILKTNSIKEKKTIKIAKDTCIVICNTSADKETLLDLNDTTFGDYTIQIKLFTPVNNEIIFIKYNDKELKYMYVCANCKTSWKN